LLRWPHSIQCIVLLRNNQTIERIVNGWLTMHWYIFSTHFAFVIHFCTFGLFCFVLFLTDTEAKSNWDKQFSSWFVSRNLTQILSHIHMPISNFVDENTNFLQFDWKGNSSADCILTSWKCMCKLCYEAHIPYFPVYKSIRCISRPYFLSLKVEILLICGE